MKPHRIERLLEARNLEEEPADDAEVAGIWAAALREWSDASVPGLSVAGAFTHAYQAGFRAATAVLRAAGYRPRGAVGGHHYITFYAAGALGDEEMERITDALQSVRGGGTRRCTGTRRSWSRKTWRAPAGTFRGCSARCTAGWSPRGRRSHPASRHRRPLPRRRVEMRLRGARLLPDVPHGMPNASASSS